MYGWLCTLCVPDAQGALRRVLEPPELELQMVPNLHAGAGELKEGPLGEQPVLFTAEPSPQPPEGYFYNIDVRCGMWEV